MIGVLSPYHLTTREPTAMAALVLSDRVVTLLPEPGTPSLDGVTLAAERVPAYLAFMESWAWSVPLWESGVIASRANGEDPAVSVRRELDRIAADPRCEPLRPLMNARMLGDDEEYLDAIAQDVLRSGTDPGVAVPVALGLDRFAAAHGLGVFRANPKSIVQQTEQKLAQPIAAFSVPLLTQCSAERLIEAREVLRTELEDLRAAMSRPDTGGLRAAAHAYGQAFELERASLMRSDDPDDPPVMSVLASISIIVMASDASLRASNAAAATYVSRTPAAAAVPVEAAAIARVKAESSVTSLVVKPIGRAAPLRS